MRSSIGALILAGGLAASACAGSGDRPDESRAESDAVAVTESAGDGTGTDLDSVASEAVTGPADDPFAGFELDAGPESNAVDRRVALLLRNQSARMAIVYADGGAGEVLLDSVPAGSDARIDILSRASTIALRSVTEDGELLRETDVAPTPDTVVIVVIAVPAAETP